MASCGSAGSKNAANCVQNTASTTSDTVAEICFTSGQNSCTSGTCDASGTCYTAPVNFANTSTGATGTIQTWTVPTTGTYTIDAYGAQGGSGTTYTGGLGARIKGDVALTAGAVLKILVGQQGGTNASYKAGGGGGGTFVTTSTNTPLIIAGGGGGGGGNSSPANGQSGLTGTSGGTGSTGVYAGGAGGAGWQC